MSIKKLADITDAEIKARGVVSLADKPNSESTYGTGGLTPTQLKLWFDKLGTFLAGKINSIHACLNGTDGAQYIQVSIENNEEIESLQDLIDVISSGDFATFLMLYSDATSDELQSLQVIINNIAEAISNNKEAISDGQSSYGTSISSSVTTNSSACTVKVNLLNSSGTQVGTTTISIPVTTIGTYFYDDEELVESIEFDDIIQSMPYAHMAEESERAKSANSIKVHSNISSISSGNKKIEIVSELPTIIDDKTIYIVMEE